MKIEIERSLSLPVPAATGWRLLENIEDVAGCLPGAKITERIDDTHYKGTVTIKLGPANVSFKGEIEIVERDAAAYMLHLRGKGADTTGTSGASLDLTAKVVSTGEASCELSGRSEVSVTGKVAAFGARLMNAVTEQLLKIFFANLQARAEKLAAESAAAAPVAAEPIVAETIPSPAAAAPPVEPIRVAPATPAPAPAEFNGLAFIWQVILGFFRSLFGPAKTG